MFRPLKPIVTIVTARNGTSSQYWCLGYGVECRFASAGKDLLLVQTSGVSEWLKF